MTKRITTCHYVLYYADPSLPYAVSALVSQSVSQTCYTYCMTCPDGISIH